MLKILKKFLIVLLIFQISSFWEVLFDIHNFFTPDIVTAQSPWLPIYTVYRDIGWGDSITATAQSLSWDEEVSENTEIQLTWWNTDFDLSVGGHYLVMYSVPIRSTSGSNRSETQSWLQLNSTGSLNYWYASSYIRRTDGDFEGYNESAAIIDASPWDTLELQIQRTNTNWWGLERTPDRSGINILKLDDARDYARLKPTSSQAITTSWVDLDLSSSDELDTGTFTLSWSDLTLQEAGKYLVTYNVAAVTTGTDRTNNETRLMLDGAEIDSTRGTIYVRAQEGSFTWVASYVGIIETVSTNQVLSMEIMRESTLAGTTNDTVVGKTWLTIVKLPDTADYVRVWENIAAGGQDMTTAWNTPITFDTTIEQWSDLEHDTVNTSEIDINVTWDYLFLHSVYNARSDTSNTNRENPYLEWQVSWTTIKYWTSGSYNRHSNDGDGITNSSHSSAWVILTSLTAWDRVELTETNEASNGTSVYVWWRMWIQWVSLSTLFTGTAYLSQPYYRWKDDTSDFGSNTWWLAAENTNISNVWKDETLRLRMKVENPSTETYANDTQFELQWAQTSWSCSNWLSWTAIGTASDAWEMVDTPHISPNAETSTGVFLSNPWGLTHILSEGYHAPNGTTNLTSSWVFVSDSQKEYEFSIQATEFALANTSYCFRLYNVEETKTLELNNYPKVQVWATPVVLDDIWWEAGKINAPADGARTTVSFAGWPYTTPVIVWRTNTHNDTNEALVFEARNVTSTWAEVRLCDSNASNSTGCQTHLAETIWYIVVDASQTSSVTWIEAGTFSASQSFDTGPWLIVTNYSETFTQTPYVFTSIQTTNGSSPIVTRVTTSSIGSFSWWICQQAWWEDDCNWSHWSETFWWIAVDPSVNPFFRDMDIGSWVSTTPSNIWSVASFSPSFETIPVGISQTVTNLWGQDAQIDEIQNVSVSGMEFRSCELDNDDDCDTHAIDTIRWMAIEEWTFAPDYLLDETHYRWYENNGALTPSTPLVDENTSLSVITWSGELRLRMLLKNWDPELPISKLAPKLQYGSGATCDAIGTWTDVWNPWWSEDWLFFNNSGLTDGTTLTGSLLLWWWHNLQTYIQTGSTIINPTSIPVWEWWEWDFSLLDNTWVAPIQYCFRVVTQFDDEIEYLAYAKIDTTDAVSPTISSFTPSSWALLPIGNFNIDYLFEDLWSWIDTMSDDIIVQRWNWVWWDSDVSWTYVSLDDITSTGATYEVTGLPYGKYRVTFEIADNAANSSTQLHILYVDQIEFTVSTGSVDIWSIASPSTVYTSSGDLTVTVKTLGAAFDVTLFPNADLTTASGSTIPVWDNTTGFWYQEPPYPWSILSHSGWVVIWSEWASLNTNGEKNTYTYNLRYSLLLDVLEHYAAWDYTGSVDFRINIDY